MNVLLDTNIIIPIYGATDQINTLVRSVLDDANKVLFSAVSLWELGTLVVKNRYTLTVPITEISYNLRIHNGFIRLDISDNVIDEYRELPFLKSHKDPFDRMLIATAITNDCAVMTRDKAFEQYDCQTILV